jgi:hypothetical protein
VNRPPQAPFDPANLSPDPAFKFSRAGAQSGEAAATEWLASQNIGRLKSMASGRGIPFDGSTDPVTLRTNLINSIVDDLSDNELQGFGDQAIERSRFSARQGQKKSNVAPPPGKTIPTDENTADLLQKSLAIEHAKKAGIPGPLAEALAGSSDTSDIPEFIKRAAGIQSEPQSMAHGASGASVEELARGERFWKIGRNGTSLSAQGVSPDSNLQPGEATIAIDRNGNMRVQDSRTGFTDAETLRRFGPKVKYAADPRNISQVEDSPDENAPSIASLATPIQVVHPDGREGTVPRKNLERALGQGYRLAQPLDSIAA